MQFATTQRMDSISPYIFEAPQRDGDMVIADIEAFDYRGRDRL